MFDSVVGKIPDFTSDSEPKEVKQEEAKPQETLPVPETPVEQTESIAAEEGVKPAEEVVNEDATEVAKQIQGLEAEKTKLLDEIKSLRGERRELKQAEIVKVDTQLDELKDLHPDDIKTIERIAKARGFMSKEEVKKMFYEEVKQEVLDTFLDKYPEFKPENDPDDKHWNALNDQIKKWYKLPENPRHIMEVLERARKDVMPAIRSEGSPVAIKRQIKTASMGAGGTQPSSSSKPLSSEQREIYRRGGWTEEEIREIEKRI